MGCAASLAAVRRDSYSPDSQKRPRQNQIVPSQDPDFRPTRSATPVSERQRSAPKTAFAEKARQRSGGSVLQSALKLRTETYVNQYKLTSPRPIGKGFQSKVWQPLPAYRITVLAPADYCDRCDISCDGAGLPRRRHEWQTARALCYESSKHKARD